MSFRVFFQRAVTCLTWKLHMVSARCTQMDAVLETVGNREPCTLCRTLENCTRLVTMMGEKPCRQSARIFLHPCLPLLAGLGSHYNIGQLLRSCCGLPGLRSIHITSLLLWTNHRVLARSSFLHVCGAQCNLRRQRHCLLPGELGPLTGHWICNLGVKRRPGKECVSFHGKECISFMKHITLANLDLHPYTLTPDCMSILCPGGMLCDCVGITETNRIRLVLFGMQMRLRCSLFGHRCHSWQTAGPYTICVPTRYAPLLWQVGSCATVSVTFSANSLAALPKLRRGLTMVATGLTASGLNPKHLAVTKEIPGPVAANFCSVGANAPCFGCPANQGGFQPPPAPPLLHPPAAPARSPAPYPM
jgi:hypothetical protein